MVSRQGTCPQLGAEAEHALHYPTPPLVFPHPAPPVLAGSALSGCDIHPDEEGAPPAKGAGGASRRDLPAWASAPRPSRRTGTRGPERVSAPPAATAAPCRRPPVTAAGRAQSRPAPCNNCCNFPRSPDAPSRPPVPAAPRSAPLRSPRLTGSAAAAATASYAPLLRAAPGTARHGSARPGLSGAVRSSTVQCSTVRYGTVQHDAAGRNPPLPAALIPARARHSAPLTATAANGKPPPGAAPRPTRWHRHTRSGWIHTGCVAPCVGRPAGPAPG